MIIDFDENQFRKEIISTVRQFGLSKRYVEKIVNYALAAVRKSSKPVRWY